MPGERFTAPSIRLDPCRRIAAIKVTLVEIPISETVSISSLNLDEAWLLEQIWDDPTAIGLGDMVGVSKERTTSSGSRLDILLKNPVDDSMYGVEAMLGDTDPSHIIRTIEYWDLVKRKWPQRQHFAVLIAKRITKRFFNVIQILSGSVPLIAIQVNIIKSPGGHSLHFTKILDVYEEADDEATQGWRKLRRGILESQVE